MEIDFSKIAKLNFQDSITVNGKKLYRSEEVSGWNTKEKTVDYLFYDAWNKEKNILPKPTHKIVIHVEMSSKKGKDNWVQLGIIGCKKGELIDLKTNRQEKITFLNFN